MQRLVQYFEATYLINLPERKDRLASALVELGRAGCLTSSIQIYAAHRFYDRATFPSASERGCFHSHTECLRKAAELGLDSVLLLEDDLALTSSLGRLMPSIIAQLNAKTWDFVYFGHENTGHIRNANSRTVEVDFVAAEGDIRTTHFYGVNGRILRRLVSHLDRVAAGIEGDQEFGPMPIDGAFNIFRRTNHDVKSIIATPKLGWQRPSRSDITPRLFDNWKYLDLITTPLRELKYSLKQWRS